MSSAAGNRFHEKSAVARVTPNPPRDSLGCYEIARAHQTQASPEATIRTNQSATWAEAMPSRTLNEPDAYALEEALRL